MAEVGPDRTCGFLQEISNLLEVFNQDDRKTQVKSLVFSNVLFAKLRNLRLPARALIPDYSAPAINIAAIQLAVNLPPPPSTRPANS